MVLNQVTARVYPRYKSSGRECQDTCTGITCNCGYHMWPIKLSTHHHIVHHTGT